MFVWSLSGKDIGDIAKLDEKGLSASDLTSLMILKVLRKHDDTPLSSESIQSLASEDRKRIVSAIIKRNCHSSIGLRKVPEKNTGQAKLTDPMERQENETDEEFLARWLRAEPARYKALVNSMLPGVSDQTKLIMGPSLAANVAASNGVSGLIASINKRRLSSLANPTSESYLQIHGLPDIPPRPIYETNDILADVAHEIGEMRDLAVQTTQMQQTLNETALEAVALFSKGAEASQKASRNGLWISGVSLFVAIIAFLGPIYLSQKQKAEDAVREKDLRAQTERLITTQGELANRVKVLSLELENARKAAVVQPDQAKTNSGSKKN